MSTCVNIFHCIWKKNHFSKHCEAVNNHRQFFFCTSGRFPVKVWVMSSLSNWSMWVINVEAKYGLFTYSGKILKVLTNQSKITNQTKNCLLSYDDTLFNRKPCINSKKSLRIPKGLSQTEEVQTTLALTQTTIYKTYAYN